MPKTTITEVKNARSTCPKSDYNRRFPPARSHALNADDFTTIHHQRVVEVVNRGTDVPRHEIKCFAYCGSRSANRDFDGHVFFARLERKEVRPAYHRAGGRSGVGRDRLVARVASYPARRRLRDHG